MDKLIDILCCPTCGTSLSRLSDGCNNCGAKVRFSNNKVYFIDFNDNEVENLFYRIKNYVKFHTQIYSALVSVFGPVLDIPLRISINNFFKKFKVTDDQIIVNIGSGNTNLTEGVINLDLVDYKNVSIVSGIERLPFRDKSIDIIINVAVLEHVKNPESVVKEIHRVLKTGGQMYSYIPFIQPFHASPYDYNRVTIEGIKYLFKDFEIIETSITAGPMSAFLWIFQEWIAIVFSFGIRYLYYFNLFIIMFLTFPFKILDLFLIKHPMASNMASGFSIITHKKEDL